MKPHFLKSMFIMGMLALIISVVPAGLCHAQTDDEDAVSEPDDAQKPNPFSQFSSKSFKNKKKTRPPGSSGRSHTGPGARPDDTSLDEMPAGSLNDGPGITPVEPPDAPAGVLPAPVPAALPSGSKNKTPLPLKTKGGADDKDLVNIDFNNVDIAVFIKYISENTGKNFVIDDRVKGKVTIVSPTKVSRTDAYKVFESVLEVYGFATVQAGDVIKIVPATDAKTKNIETRLKEETGLLNDRIITQLIPLKYADASNIKQLFTPLVSKNSIILAYAPTNMLIVTDVDTNIKRLLHILDAIDVTGIGQEVSVIPLEMADSAKLVKILDTVFKEAVQGKKGESGKTLRFVADERTNSIIAIASEGDTARAKELIGILDKEVPKGKEKIRVYYLENATAEDLAAVLQAVPQKKTVAAEGKKTAPVVSEDVKITADKATNSLIIMAENDDYQVLEEIIKKLDIPRSMVYIECLIIEVNVNKNFNFGVEWSAGTDRNFNGAPGAIGGGFSGSTLYGNSKAIAGLSTMSPGVSQLPAGFSLGVFAEPLTIGDLTFPNLGAIVQAYKTDEDVHILSTPQVLTTDNEEASITVGKNVPYQTKVSTSDNDTYNSFEYKDVGITLKITPQISKDRRIRLKIFQESSRLVGGEVAMAQPTTYKRTIDTTVVVNDGNTIVLGGLIDDSFSVTEYKVPCLGDIPVIRWLFSSIGNSREKTNLYVFLTPRVVQNGDEATAVYERKREEADKLQGGKIKMYKDFNESDQNK